VGKNTMMKDCHRKRLIASKIQREGKKISSVYMLSIPVKNPIEEREKENGL
jgi:hypothetical protein